MSEGEVSSETRTAAQPKRSALGRGLGALMGETRREEPLVRAAGSDNRDGQHGGAIALLPVAEIEPDPNQPRRHFAEDALDELAKSIAARGLIQPIVVRPLGRDRYQLVAGERRWRAAQRARLHEIPAIVRTLSEKEVRALALIENLQREDLNPVEEARAFQRLSDLDGMTQADIAGLVDKSRSHVANIMRLLALPHDVLELVEVGQLSMGHARALIGMAEPGPVARDIVAKGLSVRDAERMAKRAARSSGEPAQQRRARTSRDPADDADIAAVQAHLEEFLGLKVVIGADADPRSGTVTIRYRTLDQLDLICQRLTGGGI